MCLLPKHRTTAECKRERERDPGRSSSRTYLSLKVQKKDSKKEGDDIDSVWKESIGMSHYVPTT